MAMRSGYPWRTEDVAAARKRSNSLRDTRNFSGRGMYSPPGRGPYGWKQSGSLRYEEDAGAGSLSGTESEGWYVCPATSHLEAIRLVQHEDESEPWVLQIRFKDGGYASYLGASDGDKQRLSFILDLMTSAQRPGEIVWSHLILEKFPYDTKRG